MRGASVVTIEKEPGKPPLARTRRNREVSCTGNPSREVKGANFFSLSPKKATSGPSNCTRKNVQDAKGRKVLLFGHANSARDGETGDWVGRGVSFSNLKIRRSYGRQYGSCIGGIVFGRRLVGVPIACARS